MQNTPASALDLATHLALLDALLIHTQPLWQPQPFKGQPAWTETYPALERALLNLSDDDVARYLRGGSDLRQWLATQLPEIESLEALSSIMSASNAETSSIFDTISAHQQRDIPGRKWAQIEAFARSLPNIQRPLLEWCGGKGHLGRILALQYKHPVTTLELNAELCKAGEQLAARNHVKQRFMALDAFSPTASTLLNEQHTVALHACGELHRHLIREAVKANTPALNIAPCCYHLWAQERYTAFNTNLNLSLTRDDLRLAVTQTATAPQAQIKKRDQEMAWKLGFNQLRQVLFGSTYQPLSPINKQWLTGDFANFCQLLAEREQISLPASISWEEYEAIGWQQQAKVIRLNLLRIAFSRAIELWIVYDMALWLEQNGYQISVTTFCDEAVTPRNLLINATKRT